MSAAASELAHVTKLVRLLFHRLKSWADENHEELGVTASMRAVLEALHELGPMTVPRIAKSKSVSRQHIQVICDHLLTLELVGESTNPLRLRSPVIDLTTKGRRLFAKIRERENVLIDKLSRGFDRNNLAQARACLESLAERVAQQLTTRPDE